MSSYAFTATTLKPWDEDREGFTTAAGLKLWLDRIYGDRVTYSQLKEVREWINSAEGGDTAYLGDEFKLVAPELADIEIRCNRYTTTGPVKTE